MQSKIILSSIIVLVVVIGFFAINLSSDGDLKQEQTTQVIKYEDIK